ncbi:HAL/PAL/TAL family ammonia-lyase [Halegenticoccus tardaugens]|uniref:HAL/PAL/TAL family ammonia-lyase n=1 Tax=Halegenticoccus tardaugens TaxID=2071624 RepID=UPI00100BEAE0|nr:histidine ammonia-lyase [Halegenticoccus tardaugens]
MSEADSDADRVVLDGESLTVEEVVAVAREGAPVEIDEGTRGAIRESRARIEEIVGSDEAVYGVNTGFGELVDVRIPRERINDLQENLLRSHAAGAGRELSTEEVRALVLTRINALAKGYSGVREVVVDHLVAMLNEGIHPVVRSRGSLGASGDLAPLAHLSLVLIGEGEARVEKGEGAKSTTDDGPRCRERDGGDDGHDRLPGDEALATAGLEPLSLAAKEGLALINGTQLTVGLAALAVHDAERALRAADAAGALTTEVTMGTTASCDPAIQAVRPHPGQAASARNVKRLTEGSEIVESHRNCDRVQDAYSIRCLPQVHGAVRDAVAHLRGAVEVELNSATDNPLVFPRDAVSDRASGTASAAVLSGGNFHGEPLALRLDYVAGALTDLAAIAERRVDRMLNPNLQEPHLPPFLTAESGLRSGYMIPQYTAAALLNECRSEGRPSTDNAPVSGGQEDHVSMSATSAFTVRRVVERVRTVVAVELLCAAQAAEFVDPALSHAAGTGATYEAVREIVPPLDEDRSSHGEIEAVAALVASDALDRRVTEAIGEALE